MHAPKRIFEFQLNQILQEKSNWILTKLQAREANQVEKIQWQDGEHLLYLGQDIQLKLVACESSKHKKSTHFQNYELAIHAPQANIHAVCGRMVLMWYKKQAALDFARRLEVFAAKLGVPTPPLTLSNAQSRWGSCNSRGEVRLSWRLLQAPPHIINYVICHELAHLKQMNHSAKFYAVLESLFPQLQGSRERAETTLPTTTSHVAFTYF